MDQEEAVVTIRDIARAQRAASYTYYLSRPRDESRDIYRPAALVARKVNHETCDNR